MGVAISIHAMMRYRERGDACSDLCDDALRVLLEGRLDRAALAAASIGGGDYLILIDDLAFVVRDGTVTTVVTADNVYKRAKLLGVVRES